MSQVRRENAEPERAARGLMHQMGLRFRIHVRDLPGTPDVVLPKYRCVVFVHGCFWHGHDCGTKPQSKTRAEYWSEKISRNKARDVRALKELRAVGWKPIVIW